ncbi:hypothetical protein DUI87_08712 [Hirundo rustica rustica]|uniref:Uncharacterized protein n=1 Tax=Hirundo rustica rustica TaxID=333673 RepID=A0A3M0KKP5_HIRRU|nr:hypothetical protein DUI87_08712 [Hirundo rustica rustica]
MRMLSSMSSSNAWNQATRSSNAWNQATRSSNAWNQATRSSNAWNQATRSSNAWNNATRSSNAWKPDPALPRYPIQQCLEPRYPIQQCMEQRYPTNNPAIQHETTLPNPAMHGTTLPDPTMLGTTLTDPAMHGTMLPDPATLGTTLPDPATLGTMLHGPQLTMLPLPLLETRRHMLLGSFLLTAPDIYTENSLSQGRPRQCPDHPPPPPTQARATCVEPEKMRMRNQQQEKELPCLGPTAFCICLRFMVMSSQQLAWYYQYLGQPTQNSGATKGPSGLMDIKYDAKQVILKIKHNLHSHKIKFRAISKKQRRDLPSTWLLCALFFPWHRQYLSCVAPNTVNPICGITLLLSSAAYERKAVPTEQL